MKLKISMKSGKDYKTMRLKSYSIKHVNGSVTSLSVKYTKRFRGKGVILETLNLNNIEAVGVIK